MICSDPRHKQRQGPERPVQARTRQERPWRIAGVNIPNHQHAVIALQAIGIGPSRAKAICASTGVVPSTKIRTCPTRRWTSCASVENGSPVGRPPPRDDDIKRPDGPGLLPPRPHRKDCRCAASLADNAGTPEGRRRTAPSRCPGGVTEVNAAGTSTMAQQPSQKQAAAAARPIRRSKKNVSGRDRAHPRRSTHDHHDHRPAGQRCRGRRRAAPAQGELAQVDAVRAPGRRRAARARNAGMRRRAASESHQRARAPAAVGGPRAERWDSRSRRSRT